MLAWLVTNKYYVSDSFLNIVNSFIEASKKLNIKLVVQNNVDLRNLLFKRNYEKPNFVIFWDKDVKLASMIENEGIRVFNSSESIRICDDKSLTYLKLCNSGIKQPKTIISPLLYFHSILENEDFIDFVVSELKFPLVFKECFGSFGKQVFLIKSKEELIATIKSVNDRPFILQEFIQSSFGKDLRVYVVGDKIVAAMKRFNDTGDFRANIEAGSKGEPYTLNDKQTEMALTVAKTLKLDYAGIDLLFGNNDEPIFCEANSNAYFNAINRVNSINIENYILEYAINHI